MGLSEQHSPGPALHAEDTMQKTFYLEHVAHEIAEENRAEDPEWEYRVVPTFGGRAWIEVYDEDGEFVGYL